jgi:hypothetical protein
MRELPWRVSTEGGKKILLKWRRGDLLFDFSRRDDTQSSPLNKKVDNQAIKKRDSWRWVGAHPLDCVGRASILFISLSILVLHGAIYFLASIVNHYQTGEEYVRNKLNVPAAVVVVLLAQGSRDCVTRSKEKISSFFFGDKMGFIAYKISNPISKPRGLFTVTLVWLRHVIKNGRIIYGLLFFRFSALIGHCHSNNKKSHNVTIFLL